MSTYPVGRFEVSVFDGYSNKKYIVTSTYNRISNSFVAAPPAVIWSARPLDWG